MSIPDFGGNRKLEKSLWKTGNNFRIGYLENSFNNFHETRCITIFLDVFSNVLEIYRREINKSLDYVGQFQVSKVGVFKEREKKKL